MVSEQTIEQCRIEVGDVALSTLNSGIWALAPFHGFCLEPQGFPNAVNEIKFPSILATPEMPYHQRLMVEIVEVAP